MSIQFNGTCNRTRSALYRRAYYASAAYQDYNIGMVLDELQTLGVAANTLVVLMGTFVHLPFFQRRAAYLYFARTLLG